jgi:hypothetical protein
LLSGAIGINSPEWTPFDSKHQIIVHSDLDILLGVQIPFGGLDGRVPEQKLDLLEIPAALAAEFGTGATKVMSAKVLDPDLLR